MTQPFLLTDDPLPNGTLIEASAGTGKTYSVAAIVTQAIAIDDDRRSGSVLVTTYTRHAAAELKNRIRGRMVATALLLRGDCAVLRSGENLACVRDHATAAVASGGGGSRSFLDCL